MYDSWVTLLTSGTEFDVTKHTWGLLVVATAFVWYLALGYDWEEDVSVSLPDVDCSSGQTNKKLVKKVKRHKRATVSESADVARPPTLGEEVECNSGYISAGNDEQVCFVAKDVEGEQLLSDCCVCLEEAATCAILPCRHLCLCAGCESIGLDLCPICREKIIDIVPVGCEDADAYFLVG